MDTNFTSQEILLVINTKFAAGEYQQKDENKEKARPEDRLAEACWNGMLRQRLPEISIERNRKPLPMWEMNRGRYSLYCKLGEIDEEQDPEYTIHPYRFAEAKMLN